MGSQVIGRPVARIAPLAQSGSRMKTHPGYGSKFGEAAHSWKSISASATQIRSEGNFRDAGGRLTSSTNALVENPIRSQSSWV
jgi:antitoxin (DNA-binding transcriptional repressor) of toxin-antitoxin stability system